MIVYLHFKLGLNLFRNDSKAKFLSVNTFAYFLMACWLSSLSFFSNEFVVELFSKVLLLCYIILLRKLTRTC